jgi:hypothetical protein
MWKPDFHGAGHAALNIQGRSKLLPPKRFADVRATSALPPKTDIHREARHVSKVPMGDIDRSLELKGR